jgi:NADH:ubiquinone oxidoreductase subunit 6 (subunit J)
MMSTQDESTAAKEDSQPSFLTNILTPGSSLHPTFLFILDVAFALLFITLVGLLFLTRGSVHIFALIGIEGSLWASVKW